jgi:hypothetical protein
MHSGRRQPTRRGSLLPTPIQPKYRRLLTPPGYDSLVVADPMVDLDHGFPTSGYHDNGTGFNSGEFDSDIVMRNYYCISRDASDVIVNVKEERNEGKESLRCKLCCFSLKIVVRPPVPSVSERPSGAVPPSPPHCHLVSAYRLPN